MTVTNQGGRQPSDHLNIPNVLTRAGRQGRRKERVLRGGIGAGSNSGRYRTSGGSAWGVSRGGGERRRSTRRREDAVTGFPSGLLGASELASPAWGQHFPIFVQRLAGPVPSHSPSLPLTKASCTQSPQRPASQSPPGRRESHVPEVGPATRDSATPPCDCDADGRLRTTPFWGNGVERDLKTR